MNEPTELQLAKDFIELSILINPDKKFSLPDNYIDDIHRELLNKALFELEKEGKIKYDI